MRYVLTIMAALFSQAPTAAPAPRPHWEYSEFGLISINERFGYWETGDSTQGFKNRAAAARAFGLPDTATVSAMLNAIGDRGWELVIIHREAGTMTYNFKRQR